MKKYILFFLLLSCGSEESRLADSYYQNKNYNKAIEYYTESQRGGNTDLATMGLILGFIVMMSLDVALG